MVSRCSVYITALWSGAYIALWSALHMLRCDASDFTLNIGGQETAMDMVGLMSF